MATVSAPPGVLYALYGGATALAAPLIHALDARKMRERGVPADRISERRGRATRPRPDGRLIWFHAVSVGEALSVLGLIDAMGKRLSGVSFLVTTVTTTSADLVERRLPPRTVHQYAPLDTPGPARAFLAHWQPNLAVFVESEIWPRLIVRTDRLGSPLALVNARLSRRSIARWQIVRGFARAMFSRFGAIMAQTPEVAEGLRDLGARPHAIEVTGDLKASAAPLEVVSDDLAKLRGLVGNRPVWAAASTHPGEEKAALQAHRAMLDVRPDALLLLIPRHPERADAVARDVTAAGMRFARRSVGEDPDSTHAVYLADTLGEMGLWYSLAPLVFLGGSLEPIGGHNPYEPAAFGAALLYGPHVPNFASAFAAFSTTGAAEEVPDAGALARRVPALLGSDDLAQMRAAVRRTQLANEDTRDRVADRLIALLGQAG
ncbi:MAG: 3-deoxy-D-manno-octulosonic acid transferase [Pseudomonadota bacterium]